MEDGPIPREDDLARTEHVERRIERVRAEESVFVHPRLTDTAHTPTMGVAPRLTCGARLVISMA
jgi:hypothetical protein